MRTNNLLWQNLIAAETAEPTRRNISMHTREIIRAPVFKDDLIDTVILREIFVGGVSREVGEKVLMASSDAHALASTIPPTISFCK
jgi:hypothetical protein